MLFIVYPGNNEFLGVIKGKVGDGLSNPFGIRRENKKKLNI